MAAVSELVVREYFELHGFFVRQQRKYVASVKRDAEEIDFCVDNPNATPGGDRLPFVLASTDLAFIRHAIVAVKGWHTDTFSVAFMTGTPELFRFLEPPVFQQAARSFGPGANPKKILVLSALPQTTSMREQSLKFLEEKGIDAVIAFPTMLADLIILTEESRNYQKSDLLQIIRLMKNYDFFRDPQMDLFRPARRTRSSSNKPAAKASAETAPPVLPEE
jgi:hypothetical protein